MESYYINQAGNGISLQAFHGTRAQRGHGFFGRLISRTVLPLLRYLGGKVFETGKNIYGDLDSGIPFESAFKNRGLDTLQTIVNDGFSNLRQKGNGIKRRRSKKSAQSCKRLRKSKLTSKKRKLSTGKVLASKKRRPLRSRKTLKPKTSRKNKLKPLSSVPDFL